MTTKSELCRFAATGIALIAAASMQAALAAEWFVDDDAASEVADGSLSRPFSTIQAAVEAAASGDTIHVAEGLYSASSGAVESNTRCEAVVIIRGKKLHLVGAGRGKSVIAGSRDPAAGNSYASHTASEYARRCVYVVGSGSAGTVIEGFTLRDGETMTSGTSKGPATAGGGLYADREDVYLVDSDVVHCAGKYGSSIYKGTAVRCLFDDNYGTGGPGGYGSRLINCVVTRSQVSGSSTATLYDSEMYNCTVVDNESTWTVQTKDDKAYNSVLVLSANSLKYRETNVVDTTVANCVLASRSSRGVVQLMGPAVGDWRLLPDSDAVGMGDAAHLSSLNLPEGIDAFVDFAGEKIEPDGNGRINAGAVQATGTPAAGALWFNGRISVNGRVSRNGKAATYVYPDCFPTQYCVRAALGSNQYPYRLARYNPNTGKIGGAYPSVVPQLDGRMWLMPPANASVTVTNEMQKAGTVLWVDAENGSDDWGEEVADKGSAAHPYATIQAAVNAVSTSENVESLVNVRPGVYSNGVAEVANVGRFRLCVKGGKVRIAAVEGPEKTVICGEPDPDTKDLATDIAGMGTNAVRCAYLEGCNVYLQGFTIANGYSDHGIPAYEGGKNGAAVWSKDGTDNRASVVDCVITNCHSYETGVLDTMLHRTRVLDCFSKTRYFVQAGIVWGCYFRGCVNASTGSDTTGIVKGDAYQSTFVGTPESGRLCGTGYVSYNSIWDGCASVFSGCVFTDSLTWNVKRYWGDTASVVADPLFVSREEDGVLRSDSPAVGMGCNLWDSSYGDMFWRHGGGDINGEPIVFTDGRPTIGAFQRTSGFRKITAAKPANGGWALSDGTAFGDVFVCEGQRLEIVPANGTRPCIGVSCGDREYFFTNSPNGTISIDYGELAEIGEDLALTGIYSTHWYVDDDGDDANSGFLPARPKKTLAAAIPLLAAGDTLWALPGTYADGEAFYSSHKVPFRAVLKGGISVISTEGPEKTVIAGASATEDPDEYGCGTNAVRCAFVAANSRLSGFTLTGGRVNRNASQEVDRVGSAVYGRNRSANCIVDNCIISNNVCNIGTVYLADVFDSLIVDNRAFGQGVGVRQGNAYNCRFSGNVGNSVISYPQNVIGCTVAADNLNSSGDRAPHLADLVDDGRVFNCLFMGIIDVRQSGSIHGAISNVVCETGSGFNAHNSTGNVHVVDFGSQRFVDGCVPVAGANAAVDAADETLCTNLYTKADLRGFQRVMNGRRDIGAYEADWRGVFARTLNPSANALTVDAASPHVVKDGGALAIRSGTLAITWRNTTGKGMLYRMPARVTGGGTLRVTHGGELFGTVRKGDGEVAFSHICEDAAGSFAFSYEPGEADDGCAIIGGFERSRMAGFVFTVR